jgi:DNA oxidative demethylase
MTEGLRLRPGGGVLHRGYLSRTAQAALLTVLRSCVETAPLFRPVLPRTDKPFSVRMTSLGALGWVSDKDGYRYQPHHPVTGTPWPDMPSMLQEIWVAVTPDGTPLPDACLVNYYESGARMGLHQDTDETDLTWPVVSASLGDEALFRLGGQTRRGRTMSFRLCSGDVLVLKGEDRLAFHGVDRIYPGTSSLLKQGGRISLTLRVAG